MTRDEFEATLMQARKFGGFGLDPYFRELLAHDAEQRQVIEDLQKRVEELIDRRNNFHREVVEWRGIDFDNVCTECSGSGYKVYGNTTTYHHGAGGQAITTSVCNTCWGSGDKYRPWTSWLKIEGIQRQLDLLKSDDAERCILIRDMEDEERRKDAGIDQQEQEIARLRAALKDAMNLIDVDNLTTQTVYRNCQYALKETTK